MNCTVHFCFTVGSAVIVNSWVTILRNTSYTLKNDTLFGTNFVWVVQTHSVAQGSKRKLENKCRSIATCSHIHVVAVNQKIRLSQRAFIGLGVSQLRNFEFTVSKRSLCKVSWGCWILRLGGEPWFSIIVCLNRGKCWPRKLHLTWIITFWNVSSGNGEEGKYVQLFYIALNVK